MSRRLYIALFVLAFESTLVLNHFGRTTEIQGGGEAVAVASSLVRSGSFSDPFVSSGVTGPSAHVPPVYPLVLAAVMKLFGSHTNTAGFVLLALVFGLHALLLPRISLLFFGRVDYGLYGAALCICLPLFDLSPAWDAVYTATALMAFCLVSWRLLQAESSTIRVSAIGLFGSILVLLNPVSALVFVPWLAFVGIRRRIRVAVLAGVAATVVIGCAPWVYRNWQVFHAFVPVRDDLGIALYSSNNDCAHATLVQNMQSGCHSQTHPIGSTQEASLVREMGEVRYNRYRQSAALQWIRTNPGKFSTLTMQRVVEFWLPSRHYPIWFVTVLSLMGWIVAVRSRTGFAWFGAVVFLLYPLMYYIVEANPRYRYPILWLTVVYAGFATGKIVEQFRCALQSLGYCHQSSENVFF